MVEASVREVSTWQTLNVPQVGSAARIEDPGLRVEGDEGRKAKPTIEFDLHVLYPVGVHGAADLVEHVVDGGKIRPLDL